MTTTSKKLTQAFRNLRKDGYFAKRNWTCCQNCGLHALPDGCEDYVFFHCQDADMLREDGKVYLAWGGNGGLIRQRCEEAGLHVVWDGTAETRLLVSDRAMN